MIPLVLTYVESDDCSYAQDSVYTFEYESKEKAENDFFSLAYTQLESILINQNNPSAYNPQNYHIPFFENNENMETFNFWYLDLEKNKTQKDTNINAWVYSGPTFYTLEEWFDANKEIVKK